VLVLPHLSEADLHTSAFFTFLRANLVLPPSGMSSPVSTPNLAPSTTTALPPPSPSRLGTSPPLTAMDDIPPLSLDVLTDHNDKVDALKLVADSIAQQRQTSSFSLVFHPTTLPVVIAGLAWTYHYAWNVRDRDLGTLLTLGSGIVMTYLLAIRFVTSKYIKLAEEVNWEWVVCEDGEPDTIIGAKFGDEMIGALVMRLEPGQPTSPAGKKKGRAATLKGGKGVIRAWTTKLRYRRRGVGGDMLREAVRLTREKCGKDAEIFFTSRHANSQMVLPQLYNGAFRKQEKKATQALNQVLDDWDGSKRKR
jgi:hypothetical protein